MSSVGVFALVSIEPPPGSQPAVTGESDGFRPPPTPVDRHDLTSPARIAPDAGFQRGLRDRLDSAHSGPDSPNITGVDRGESGGPMGCSFSAQDSDVDKTTMAAAHPIQALDLMRADAPLGDDPSTEAAPVPTGLPVASPLVASGSLGSELHRSAGPGPGAAVSPAAAPVGQ